MSAPAPAASPPPGRGRSGRRTPAKVALRWFATGTAVILLMGGCVGGIAAIPFLFARGTEFDPQAFKRRDFSYVQIGGAPVSPIVRTDRDDALYAAIRGLPTFPPAGPPRWDLVDDTWRFWNPSSQYDAELLESFLARRAPAADKDWVTWTQDHPDLAAIAWPVVVEICRDYLYVILPAVGEAVRGRTTPDGLRACLGEAVRSEYDGLIADQRAAGRADVADRLAGRRDVILDRLAHPPAALVTPPEPPGGPPTGEAANPRPSPSQDRATADNGSQKPAAEGP